MYTATSDSQVIAAQVAIAQCSGISALQNPCSNTKVNYVSFFIHLLCLFFFVIFCVTPTLSDSEIESVFGDSAAASSSRKYTPKRKTPNKSRSDSECEAELTVPKKKHLFGLLSDEGAMLAVENSQRRGSAAHSQLDSSLTTKVVNGSTAPTSWRCASTAPVTRSRRRLRNERYKKALLTAKVQLNTGTSEWHDLQKFMKSLKKLFEDREPVFYSNKVNIK
ncbi:hypothetical protein ABMA27_003048 [Loxostege sticticalis]|uniref:Uncharacterized protein n=1 Tax=Loxostege sticticalis TaxID=481309 RepID=A0ABR3HRS5_LOXSC